MFGWLSKAWHGVTGTAAAVGRAAYASAKAIWGGVETIASHVGEAWNYVVRGAKALGEGAAHVALATLHAVDYITTDLIPRWGRLVLRSAYDFARGLVRDLRDWAEAAVDFAIRTARRLVEDLKSWAGAAIRWLRDQLGHVIHLLDRVARVVFDLLLVPARLAKWVFGEIWKLLVRYIEDHAEGWGRWLFGHMTRSLLWGLDLLESIIAKVF